VPNISLTAANTIYAISGVILVIGAVLTVVGTIGAIWSGEIREKYSDERTAANEAQTARANADAAQAGLEAERIKLQVAWRRLSPQQHQILVTHLRGKLKEGVWLETVGADPEAMELHADLHRAFEEAGVKVQVFYGWERAVGVGITNGPEASKQVLRDAFRQIGVVLDENKPGFVKMSDRVEIIVGSKPPPEFIVREPQKRTGK
jgi:hypothetical protein